MIKFNNIKVRLRDFFEFNIISLKQNLTIVIQRSKYCLFLKEYKELIIFFLLIEGILICFIKWQNYLLTTNMWEHPLLANEILISMMVSFISIFGVILGLFENRRQISKQINIQSKKRATLYLLKILRELSNDVDFTIQEYECVLYHLGLPYEFIIGSECQDLMDKNPNLCILLKEFVEKFMYLDLDDEVKEYINIANLDLVEFIDGEKPPEWDLFSLISQFDSSIIWYLDKMIYDINY